MEEWRRRELEVEDDDDDEGWEEVEFMRGLLWGVERKVGVSFFWI